jgi:hypothetical protein
MKIRTQITDSQLNRIIRMIGSDPGFYMLSLFSLIEMILNNEMNFPRGSDPANRVSFRDKMDIFLDNLEQTVALDGTDRKKFKYVQNNYWQASETRHYFSSVTQSEAEAACENVIGILRVLGCESELLKAIESDHKNAWLGRDSRVDDFHELQVLQSQIKYTEPLFDKLQEYQAKEQEYEQVYAQLEKQHEEIEKLKTGKKRADEKDSERRRKLFEKSEQIKTLQNQLEQMKPLVEYRNAVSRLVSFTRTRRDFEETILRLSADQMAALKSIKPDSDFLIRGSAGSGKSVVLLKALSQALETNDLFDSEVPFALLTYNKVLRKYNRYISEVLKIAQQKVEISTSDSFIASFAERYFGEYQAIFTADIEKQCSARNFQSQLTDAQLAIEINDFIWGLQFPKKNILVM